MPAATKKVKGKETEETSSPSGVFMFPNGDKYDGEFEKCDDGTINRNGTGTHTTSTGICYQGNWVNDKMNGQGRMQFPSGAVYEGEFINNQFHGKGVYTFANDSYYDGVFVENRLEGEGQFCDTDKQIWRGTFCFEAAPGLKFKLTEV